LAPINRTRHEISALNLISSFKCSILPPRTTIIHFLLFAQQIEGQARGVKMKNLNVLKNISESEEIVVVIVVRKVNIQPIKQSNTLETAAGDL
jgi:hypothetical protein